MKDMLYQALANSADGALAVDEDQHIIYWNKAAKKILGYTSEEVSGRPCYEIMQGCDEQGQPICHHHCYPTRTSLSDGAVKNFDLCVHTRSGAMRWINMSTLAFLADDETARPTLIHLFRDVTQKKRFEQLIYQMLEAANNLQDKDSSQVSPAVSRDGISSDLTGREREVLSLLGQGLNTHDIARSLSISSSTTRNHIRNILKKLQVHSRMEAAIYALKHGFVNRD